MAHATVSRCLRRRGLSRTPKALREAPRRFEWPCPGDLLQMDVKLFARFSRPGHRVTGDRYLSGAKKRARVGYEFAHSIIDDHSRLAYTELNRDEQAGTVTAFTARALEFFAGHGITARRLQIDNRFSYKRNNGLRELLQTRGVHHRFIPIRTPKRNGKIERYQQTLAREATDSAIAQATREPPRYRSGSTTTTPPGTTANSATGHPSTAFATSRGRTARSRDAQ